MMFGAPPPPPLPPTGATHHLQTPQSGNHLVSAGSTGHTVNTNLHQNHVHPHQQAGGPTQQLQNCHFGARHLPQYVNGLASNRAAAVSTGASNSCFSNPAGVLPVALTTQAPLGHPIAAPPPPYHFQHAPNNGGQGQSFGGAPHNCNLQGIPPPIPFSTANGEYDYPFK